jgi:hypothetical protein
MVQLRALKLGHIYQVGVSCGLRTSHAQIMAPLVFDEQGMVRVFFSSRDEANTTRAFYVDLDPENNFSVLRESSHSVLDVGARGMFDEHGVMPSCAVRRGELIYLFYSGWQKSLGVPYNNYTGLAVSRDSGESFKRIFSTPVLDRGSTDPLSATSPEVYRVGNNYFAYYSSGIDWVEIDGKLEHTYDLKIAESSDLLNWKQSGRIAVSLTNKYEALCKPAFFTASDGSDYMLYSKRSAKNFRGGSGSYKIYITKMLNPYLFDQASSYVFIDVADDKAEWDAEMTAYPSTFSWAGSNYVLYNGNNFGRNGFGIAKIEER